MQNPQNWPDIAGRLIDNKHVLAIRVYYEDTDFGGGVYYANYLKFCERGRSDMLRLLGVFHTDLMAGKYGGKPLGFAVRHVESEFLLPAKIDDLLEVHTRITEAKGARLRLRQDICKDGELLFFAEVMVAITQGEGRPARMPASMAELLSKWTD